MKALEGFVAAAKRRPWGLLAVLLLLMAFTPEYLPLGGGRLTGPLSAPAVNGVVNAYAQSGSDMCAKIEAAVTALGSGGGLVDARGFSGTQACASNPLASIVPNTTLLLGNVTIQTAVPWALGTSSGTLNGITLEGTNPGYTRLVYTGTSAVNCVLCLNGTARSGIWLDNFRNLMVYGGAGAGAVTDAIQATDTQRSEFSNLFAWGATGCGMHTIGAVTDTFYRIRVNKQDMESVFRISGLTTPANGLCFDSSGGVQTTDGTVIDADVQGVTGIGWDLISASSMTFTSGTSESNGTGVSVSSASKENTLIGSDFEANSVQDMLDNGTSTAMVNLIAVSNSSNAVELGPQSLNATIEGGTINKILQDSGATGQYVRQGQQLASFRDFVQTSSGHTRAYNSLSLGWDAAAGNGEGDYWDNVYTGSNNYAHLFWALNSAGTGYNELGGFRQNGAFNVTNGYLNNGAAVIPASANGYVGTGTKVSLPTQGIATLAGGAATVNTAAACVPGTYCHYQLTRCSAGGTLGNLSVGSVTSGTSFAITSSSNTDTSVVCWQIN